MAPPLGISGGLRFDDESLRQRDELDHQRPRRTRGIALDQHLARAWLLLGPSNVRLPCARVPGR